MEVEMLARLMLYLAPPSSAGLAAAAPGAPAIEAAMTTVQKAPETPSRARLLDGRPAATLQVDDDFSRAWRRVGLALDRNGFTVEDRDRGQGLYYVRYVDPKLAGKEEPGFFARIFSGAKKEDYSGTRYRVGVQAEGKASVVAIFDSQGAPQNNDPARNIVQLLLAELR
jgi:outer membrane protein assembly factor BamC